MLSPKHHFDEELTRQRHFIFHNHFYLETYRRLAFLESTVSTVNANNALGHFITVPTYFFVFSRYNSNISDTRLYWLGFFQIKKRKNSLDRILLFLRDMTLRANPIKR